MKIKIYCLETRKKFMYDYIHSISKYIDFDLCYNDGTIGTELINDIKQFDILIFLQDVPEKIKNIKKYKNKIFVLNTEQLSRKIKLNELCSYDNIIDYSLENIQLMNRDAMYFPYGINHSEIYNFEKTSNICFIGAISEKRKYIFDKLYEKGIIVDIINDFSEEKDIVLFKYKILINIHYNDEYNIFEHLRCDRCIFNKMIIISECSLYDNLNPLKDKIILTDYEKMVDKITEVIYDYHNYYLKLYKDYDQFMINHQKKITDIYNKNYNILTK
jgi:hypothetical protein